MTTDFNDYIQQPASGVKPKQVVVLLHGYGSNGQDLISLAPYYQRALPDAVFLSPDAPFPCELGVGFQWFSLGRSVHDMGTPVRNYDDFLEGAQKASDILGAYIEAALEEYRLGADSLALVGFSQGTMMSLYHGLRRANAVAGILGYSGALLGEGDLPQADENAPPLCLIHGEHDSVVPVAAYHKACEVLSEKGYDVRGHSTPYLEHSIDECGIKVGAEFLRSLFN